MLTPNQILEQMLQHIVKFDGAHIPDSLDQAILKTESNKLFRILRVIEESSKQRFIVTASGAYLDLIGQGMEILRYPGEDDRSYRGRLAFNEHTWNNCTLNGIKEMIRHYYGIDIDAAAGIDLESEKNINNLPPKLEGETDSDYFSRLSYYDDNRIMELWKQAACFHNKDRSDAAPWSDDEGWIAPFTDFGAEWLGPTTMPGAFEVHLAAFQNGEEYLIKKRQVHQKLMAIRAAGIVVLLYFHLDFAVDSMDAPEAKISEIELINRDKLDIPKTTKETYEVIIQNGAVSSIVADIKDKLSGAISRRIVHDRQKNKCRQDYIEDVKTITDPYKLMELENGALARRSEPFRFRQSKMRNECWKMFYGVKYEEGDIAIDPKIRIPIKATVDGAQLTVASFIVEDPKIEYLVIEISGRKGKRTVALTSEVDVEQYDNINTAADLQMAIAGSKFGVLVLTSAFVGSAPIDEAYPQEYDRTAKVKTYYVRKNPMVDESHFYRGEDLHGLDFYAVMDYVDFWWRVSTINEGKMSTPTVPQKLVIAKIKDGFSRFWWRITTFDGKIIHAPATQSPLELTGRSAMQDNDAKLSDIRSWGIQLKNVNPLDICSSHSDLFVIERYNPGNKRAWRRSDIISFRLSSAEKDKIILARLPIGGISLQDPQLPWVPTILRGNVVGDIITIRFWLPEWFDFLKKIIDDIIESGFVGVYLDYMDTWPLWSGEQPLSDFKIKELVASVNNYIKVIRSKKKFSVVVHGQENWWQDDNYLLSVDAIACENVLYNGSAAINTQEATDKVNALNVFKNKNKIVMIMDYITDMVMGAEFMNYAPLVNFVPCVLRYPPGEI